jgi:hypothetical protein
VVDTCVRDTNVVDTCLGETLKWLISVSGSEAVTWQMCQGLRHCNVVDNCVMV